MPSAVSAVKVDGRRAYHRVRAGEQVALPSRSVVVHTLEVHDLRRVGDLLDVDVSLRCSSGTYVRAVARDLGALLGVGGHLTRLRRTAVGPLTVAEAQPLQTAQECGVLDLLPMEEVARRFFPVLEVDDGTARAVSYGRRLEVALPAQGRPVALLGPEGRCSRSTSRTAGVPRRLPCWSADPTVRCGDVAGFRVQDTTETGTGAPIVGIWRSLDEVPADLGRTVVTIGNFDGVHLGHRHVIRRSREVAAEHDAEHVVAVTFDPHPIAVLRPEHAPTTLTDIDRRVELLLEAGVDDVLVLEFTRAVADWTPEEFVRRVVVDGLHADAVVVGANFRFGNRAAGDVATLGDLGTRHGFRAEGIPLDGGPQVWSSTYVRSCLNAGDVEGATEALGRPFTVRGVVVRGDHRGRALGYPTANVPATEVTAAPADGVYAGWLRRLDEPGAPAMPAAISVGTNPTFEGLRARRVESYVLGRDDLELYDVPVEVSFAARLRGMKQFDSVQHLVQTMEEDCERARLVLDGAGPG